MSKNEEIIEEVPGESQYRRRTDDEIKQLALDVHAGLVFGTWNIKNPSETGMVFMILSLMDSVMIKAMQRDGIVHLYEYISKAGPRSVNGMPCFFSAHQLDHEDTQRLIDRIKKIEAALEGID